MEENHEGDDHLMTLIGVVKTVSGAHFAADSDIHKFQKYKLNIFTQF